MSTLTAAGAKLLRQARDQILAHPEAFDLTHWECGTTACVAGWMARLRPELCFEGTNQPDTRRIARACGFEPSIVMPDSGHPLSPLFYTNNFHGTQWWRRANDANEAAEHINAFLWSYGYPPNEIEAVEPARQPALESATPTNAVARTAEQPQAVTSR